MNDQAQKNQRPEFLAGEPTAEAIRKQFLDAPLAAARQPAINLGLEVLAFMAALPDAFVASEERELNRLSRTVERDNDPRMERLKVSIARATELRTTSQQGKARIDRTLVALSGEGTVFHGFVSDIAFAPQKGLTVRLTAARDGDKGETFASTTTNADGYFSIPFDRPSGKIRKGRPSEPNVKSSERMAEKLSRKTASAATAGDGNEVLARVEILDAKGVVIHEDPVPLVVNAGTVYREYVIEPKEGTNDRARYAGNPATREFHDTQNLTKRCRFDAVKSSGPIYFGSSAEAEKAGYHHCAYCFGKTKSKR
ncbi:MAG: carboxypeptidase regulatory-like domain-containing protein [Nitrospira sp.]